MMNKIATGVLAVLILIHSCRFHPGTQYRNESPYPFQATFTDGSKVTMKTGATLLVADDFGQSNRYVDFEGEGMFEIAPASGKPFIIHTSALLIEVLGTRFRLSAPPGEHGEDLNLFEGQLRVTKAYHSDIEDNDTLLMKTGDMLMINTDIDLMQNDPMSPEEIEKAENSFKIQAFLWHKTRQYQTWSKFVNL
jgi:ferric-dicitrate binding protein FerR (iron transport regulator)